MTLADIKGVIALSGIYVIPAEKAEGIVNVNPLVPPIRAEGLMTP